MKIMILGSAGMLGHIVYHYLTSLNRYYVVDASFPQKLHEGSKLLDVTNPLELKKYITEEKPAIVINCIGILIKGSQSDPSNAIYLNAYFPHQLAKILRETGGKLLHVSTDCVFSRKKGGYTETDFRDADDIYGRSKAIGEVINNVDVTLRTSIIGPELTENGEGLFHWFMKQKGEILGFTQAFWNGVTTLELAKVIVAIIEHEITGLINIASENKISKYDLLILIKNIWQNHQVSIKLYEGKKVDKSLISIRNDFNYQVNSYESMLKDLYTFMAFNNKLYTLYRHIN